MSRQLVHEPSEETLKAVNETKDLALQKIGEIVKDTDLGRNLTSEVEKLFDDLNKKLSQILDTDAEELDLASPLVSHEAKLEPGVDDLAKEADAPKGQKTDPCLEITVVQGKNLQGSDRNGQGDPYLKFAAYIRGKDKPTYETKSHVIKRDVNPAWNFDPKVPADLVNRGRVSRVTFTVVDKNLLSDKVIGSLDLELGKDVEDGGQEFPKGKTLDIKKDGKVTGQLVLKIKYVSARLAHRLSTGFE